MEERTNLQVILSVKNISTKAVQAVIGAKQEKTAYEKINRIREFKLGEAKAIKNNLCPEYDFDYLFEGYDQLKTEEPECV